MGIYRRSNICDHKDSANVNELPVLYWGIPLYIRLYIRNVLGNGVRRHMSIISIELMRGFLKLPL